MKQFLSAFTATLLLTFPLNAIAAIALDAADASMGSVSSATSLTCAHTNTGTNLIDWTFVETGGASSGTTDVLSGATAVQYNGNNETRATTTVFTNGGNNRVYLYYIVGQATGAKNVVITASATTDIRCGTISYTGAAQSGVPDAFGGGQGSMSGSTVVTNTITTVLDNTWMVLGQANNRDSPIADTNAVLRINNAGAGWGFFDTNSAQTPAGSKSMSWHVAGTGGDGYGVVMASFAPAATAVPSDDDSDLLLF